MLALSLPLSLSVSLLLLVSQCFLPPSLPLSLLASVSSSISFCFPLSFVYIYTSSFPHSPPCSIHYSHTSLQIHSHLKAPRCIPSSPPHFIILSSNVTSSERPALVSKHYHYLSSLFPNDTYHILTFYIYYWVGHKICLVFSVK